MNGKYNLEDIYNDFFGNRDIYNPQKVEDSHNIDTDKIKDDIDDLYIDDESKNLLIKIIKYMKSYKDKKENNYVPFYILLEVNNNNTREKIENILHTVSTASSYINNSERKVISLYKMDDINNYKESFLTFHELKGLSLEDDKSQNKFFHFFENILNLNTKQIIIVSGSKDEISNFFLGREEIKNKYFRCHIKGINPDVQDIYSNIIEKVIIDDNQKIELLDYLGKTYVEDCDYINYQNDIINYISFNKEIPKLDNTKNIDDIFKELDDLVGLKKVKTTLHELVDLINLKEQAKDNLKIGSFNMHMVFLGNPGTGKTTVARMIANILYRLNYIKENKLIEVSSKDLVGEYVGWTAPKTMQIIEKSLNGVLFIDEAYTLSASNNNSYNAEAIATLIQAMENNRDKLVVIFAGYTKEMQDFLNSNSGIASRIGYELYFDDYTTDELIQIFTSMMKKSGFKVLDEATDYLKEIVNSCRLNDNFGNARFIRNVYEKTIIKHAVNVKGSKNKTELKTITKNDISIDNIIFD